MSDFGPNDDLPIIIALVADIPSTYGFLAQPPICRSVTALQINNDDGTEVTDGRFNKARTTIDSTSAPKLQDTYITGTSGRTGRAFSVLSGTWRSDFVSEKYGTYCVAQTNCGATDPLDPPDEILADDTTEGIEDATIILRRQTPPPSVGVDVTHAADKWYTHIYLAFGGDVDVRIVREYGKPVRLEYTTDLWATVIQGPQARDVPAPQQAEGFSDLWFHIQWDKNNTILHVDMDDGNSLRFAFPDDVAPPEEGRIDLLTKNGFTRFEYYPQRYDNPSIKLSPRGFGKTLDTSQMQTFPLPDGVADPGLTVDSTTKDLGDGMTFQTTVDVSKEDAGDSLGSDTPSSFKGITIYSPGTWTDRIDDTDIEGLSQWEASLPTAQIYERQVFDTISRMVGQSAVLLCPNEEGVIPQGGAGNLACQIWQGDFVGPLVNTLTGIAGVGEGVGYERDDPTSMVRFPIADKSFVMQKPLNDYVAFDNWALPAVVWFLCEKGNVNPDRFLANVPYYPPGPVTDPNCPYYILGSGLGLNPQFGFEPSDTPWSILQTLCINSVAFDMSDPYGFVDPNNFPDHSPYPFYMGFDVGGMFHFEPVSKIDEPSQWLITDTYYPGAIRIAGKMTIRNSVQDVRTAIELQGLDARTNELLYHYLPLPPAIVALRGFNYELFERNARFSTQAYIEYVAATLSVQASLPQQIIDIPIKDEPGLLAGHVVTVYESQLLGGAFDYVVEEKTSIRGFATPYDHHDENLADAVLKCRWVQNTV